jgi:hypothetical protein
MTAHDELRARALAATPGPWTFTNYEGSTHVWCGRAMSSMVADNHTEGAVCRVRGVGAGLPIMENAAFIAAASPDVVLALLDEIAALRAERAWQPIETAPRVRVLARMTDGATIIAVRGMLGWYDDDDRRVDITSWMPLPEAP